MKLEEISSQPCSIARALSEVGDGWSLILVRDAFYGRTRFSDFVKYTGAQRSIISDRLKRLVADGIFKHVAYEMHPPRHEYQLTDKGADLAHVMLALSAWGDRWLDEGRGAPIKITHTECGHPAGPRIACAHCGGDLGAGDLRAEPGPGYPANGPAIFNGTPEPSQLLSSLSDGPARDPSAGHLPPGPLSTAPGRRIGR